MRREKVRAAEDYAAVVHALVPTPEHGKPQQVLAACDLCAGPFTHALIGDKQLGDVVRRMKMSRGTRAAIGRKGFDADLVTLASASYEDFMEAMKISTPNETIVSAAKVIFLNSFLDYYVLVVDSNINIKHNINGI